jgi:rhodanese-related sulfurtransferase
MNKKLHVIYVGSFFVVGLAVLVLLAINGYQYYSTPIEERFFDPSHAALKPSGAWGHGFGIIGTLMMIFGVAIYMIRKRSRKLFTFGYLKHWLEFHIFLCTVGPILVLYHTAFKFGGIVSVSFWSMVLVVLSGVVGRFIYIQIPRTIQGKEIDINDLASMREDLIEKMKQEMLFDVRQIKELDELASPERYKSLNILDTLLLYFKDFFQVRSFLLKLKKNMTAAGFSKIRKKEIINKAQAEIILSRRLGMLRTMQNLFRYWHVAHLPFAIAMFVIMIIHVIVTITFGYKWIL